MKKLHWYALSVAGLLVVPSLASAQETPAATPPSTTAQSAPAEDPNDIICKTGAPTTGSRLGAQRTCHTRKEWADMQSQSQQDLSQTQLQSRYGMGGAIQGGGGPK